MPKKSAEPWNDEEAPAPVEPTPIPEDAAVPQDEPPAPPVVETVTAQADPDNPDDTRIYSIAGEQAPLQLANYLSMGLTMAEARAKLGMAPVEPATESADEASGD